MADNKVKPSTINIPVGDNTGNEHTYTVSGIRFAEGMDKDKMRRIFSGKMNGYEYTIMCNAVLTDSEYSDSPKKRG